MSKLTLTGFMLLLLLLFISPEAGSRSSATKNSAEGQVQPARRSLDEGGSGTFQKMIVENGSVTMDLDLNRLNGISSGVSVEAGVPPANSSQLQPARLPLQLQFALAANSFFTILVLNDQLRGPESGSMALVLQGSPAAAINAPGYSVPVSLAGSLNQLVIEKLPSSEAFDLAVRDAKTGFAFFNIEGHQYAYDPNAQLLSITGGNLLVSKDFANALGRPSDSGAVVGKISIGATMQPVEVQTLLNGELRSVAMPPLQRAAGPEAPTLVAGPDVIVGSVDSVEQPAGATNGNFVGLGVGTTSCNNGTQPVNWFQLPNTGHPVIPQNLYRMSGGASNNARFEQLGQSWMKHAFFALENNQCSFGCNTIGCSTGSSCAAAAPIPTRQA
jgi:hypothetical protein